MTGINCQHKRLSEDVRKVSYGTRNMSYGARKVPIGFRKVSDENFLLRNSLVQQKFLFTNLAHTEWH